MNLRKVGSILLTILCFVGIFYTMDISQENNERLFLTEKGLKDYIEFKETFKEKYYLLVLKKYKLHLETNKVFFHSKVNELISNCNSICSNISSDNLPSSFKLFLPLEGSKYLATIIVSDKQQDMKKIISNISKDDYWKDDLGNLNLISDAYTNLLLDTYSQNIKIKLFPSMFAIIFVFLLFVTRNLNLSFIIYLPSLFSTSLSMVVLKVFIGNTNLITSIIPLMMFVINLSVSLHIYFSSLNYQSLEKTLKEKFKPLLLMVMTTFLGLISLTVSEIRVIKIFGLLSAVLLLISIPITLVWFKLNADHIIHKIKINKKNILYKYFKKSFSPYFVVLLCILGMIIGSYSFTKIKTITDATMYFPEKSNVRKNILLNSKKILGLPIVNVIVHIKSDQEKFSQIVKINQFEKEIEQLNLPYSIKIISQNKLIKLANFEYSKNIDIPLIKVAYDLLLSSIPQLFQNQFGHDGDYKMIIFGPPVNVDEYRQLVDFLNEVAKKYSLNIINNGLYYQLMISQEEMIKTLIKSFTLSLLIICFFSFVYFKKVKIFLIFFIVNIIPVLISFFFLKLFNLSFNIATVMTYSISLGLIVDSTYHIVFSLLSRPSYDQFYQSIIIPVFLSSIILSVAFLSFGLNSFLPIREFGICLAIIVLIGLVFDLKVLPSILTGSKNYVKNNE